MNTKRFQEIALGPRQVFLFDLEDQTAEDQQRVETCLSDIIRINGLADLEAFVHSAAASLGLSDFQVVQHLFWLAHDLKIHFRADGKKIAPNTAKRILTESSHSTLMLGLNKQIEAAVFHKARQIQQRLTQDDGAPADQDQIQFAHRLTQQMREWKTALEKYGQLARQPGFPGAADIKAGLDLISTIAANLDAYSLIHAFVEHAENLDWLAGTIHTLAGFYGSETERWQVLVKFDQAAGPIMAEPVEAPGIEEAYERFRRILSSPRPYDSVEQAWQLYHQSLKVYYDSIVMRQTRQCREAALAGVDGLIQDMKKQLDRYDAKDDVRNQALYALRIKARSIHAAGGMEEINRLALAAHEAFEVWLAALESA